MEDNVQKDFSWLRPVSKIYEAYKRIKSHVTRTPLMHSARLSEKF